MIFEPHTLRLILWIDVALLVFVLALLVAFYVIRPRVLRIRSMRASSESPGDVVTPPGD